MWFSDHIKDISERGGGGGELPLLFGFIPAGLIRIMRLAVDLLCVCVCVCACSFFLSQCFERVKEYSPEALDKVVAIAGNISDPGLGIGQEDAKTIKENVSVVFHLAATVKFDAPLRYLNSS